MNDKEKFEDWSLRYIQTVSGYNKMAGTGTLSEDAWMACAEIKNKKIKELESELSFTLNIANWDNISREETDKLVVLYKKYGKMDNEGNLK